MAAVPLCMMRRISVCSDCWMNVGKASMRMVARAPSETRRLETTIIFWVLVTNYVVHDLTYGRDSLKSSFRLPSGPRLAISYVSRSIVRCGLPLNQVHLSWPIHAATGTIRADCAVCARAAIMAVICTLDLQADIGFSLNQSRRMKTVKRADVPNAHVNNSHRHSKSVYRLLCWPLVGCFLGGKSIGGVGIKKLSGC
jgi:hypothetical protein